jgi:hypothetical protein
MRKIGRGVRGVLRLKLRSHQLLSSKGTSVLLLDL